MRYKTPREVRGVSLATGGVTLERLDEWRERAIARARGEGLVYLETLEAKFGNRVFNTSQLPPFPFAEQRLGHLRRMGFVRRVDHGPDKRPRGTRFGDGPWAEYKIVPLLERRKARVQRIEEKYNRKVQEILGRKDSLYEALARALDNPQLIGNRRETVEMLSDGMSMEEIGKRLGVTRERVRQYKIDALLGRRVKQYNYA